MRKKIVSIVWIFSALVAYSAQYNVPADFLTIQEALDQVAAGDTIVVEPGTYPEPLIWPQVQDIKLISGQGPETTILDGKNNFRPITVQGRFDRDTLIEGFTIENGLDWVFASPFDAHGGGIYLEGASITIRNCHIRNCLADGAGEDDQAYGGGIDAWYCSPVITACLIEYNVANSRYATASWGGGIYLSFGPGMAQITNNIVRNNESQSCCDGITVAGSAYVANNIVYDNNIDGIIAWSSNSIVVNNSIGDHIRTALASVWFYNTLFNNIVYSDGRFGIHGNNSPAGVGWNISYGSEEIYREIEIGIYDFQEDPKWDAQYHLTADSPAIDTGLKNRLYRDIDGDARSQEKIDRGADEYTTPKAVRMYFEEGRHMELPGDLLDSLPYQRNFAKFDEDYCYVPDDYATIQEALNTNLRYIYVRPGVYYENIIVPTDRRRFELISLDGPESTIIDGGMKGRVILSRTLWDLASIDGFTIKNGKVTDQGGAGIKAWRCNLKVTNCIFESNIIECTEGKYCSGAAIQIWKDSTEPLIIDCIFKNNEVNGSGTGQGGAISVVNDPGSNLFEFNFSAEIWNSIFENNYAPSGGGAIYTDSPIAILGNLFTGNLPGAILTVSDGVSLVNNTLVSNSEYGFKSEGEIPGVALNNVITDHESGIVSGPILNAHNIFWNNSVDLSSVDYGTGDRQTDPMLDEDYVPFTGSPCIDAGITVNITTGIGESIRPLGDAIDIGAIEHDPDNPRATSTPAPSPTPVCIALGSAIRMPSHFFRPGDPCACSITVCNPGTSPIEGHPLFVILYAGGWYFYAPGFDAEVDFYMEDYGPGETILNVLDEFSWPTGTGSTEGIIWYAALTDPEIIRIEGEWDSWEFGWGD